MPHLPAGDAHPPLLAAQTDVELSSTTGTRTVPIDEFYTGVKKHAGRPDELITAVLITPPAGPQQFSKIGTRNAMVISVAAFGLALHPDRGEVRTGIGSAAPTPRRARQAETFLGEALDRRRSVGVAGRPAGTARAASSASWSRPRPSRSTTSAAPRRTACTRCR